MGEDEVDALADVGEQAGPRPVDGGAQVAPHEGQRETRQAERDALDGQGRARADRRGQDAGDGRTEDEADRVDRLEDRSSPGRSASGRPGPARTPCTPARKNARSTLIGAATSRMTTIVGPPRNTESGISAVSTPRPRSARNIIRLRSLRSARAPATIPNTRSGSVCSAPTMPIASPDPVRARTSSGRAVKLTASPSATRPGERAGP